MSRLLAIIVACLVPFLSHAQDLGGLARVAEGADARAGWFGGVTLTLPLTQAVPFRAYTLNDPPRLVVDFREVDWTGFDNDEIAKTTAFKAVQTGPIQSGWSRLVAELKGPLVLETADMAVDDASVAVLSIVLGDEDPVRFAATSGAPQGSFTAGLEPVEPDVPDDVSEQTFVVVLDPGHGGVDPGAERDGAVEKHLMLTFARELKENLQRRGEIYVILTRQDDSFVSLERRVSIAHQVDADLFLSLHADALAEGRARGAAVHTLSDEASDTATENLVQRHNRADVLAGEDLSGADDKVAQVLLDLARQETQPRSVSIARQIIQELDTSGIPVNSRPLRHGGFSVLKSANIPSVLLEIGFLSDAQDLANLQDEEWRRFAVSVLGNAILHWYNEDQAKKGLVRN